MLLEKLKFVQGSVAKKDFAPELNHFYLGNGTIKGYNGKISLCAPLDIDIEAAPKAIPFIKAIQACKDEVNLRMTPAGRLTVESGRFKAFIDCVELTAFPEVGPTGDHVDIPEGFLQVVKTLFPFTAEDASRPWARGILFWDHFAYATNNIIVIEHRLPAAFPLAINVPRMALAEVLRIGRDPISLQVEANSCSFHYDDGSWLYTLTSSVQWPNVEQVLTASSGDPQPFPTDFFSAVEEALPFAEKVQALYLTEGQLATDKEMGGAGAVIQVPELTATGCFNGGQLMKLKGVATAIDWSKYPKPCPFVGEDLRGAIAGMRE